MDISNKVPPVDEQHRQQALTVPVFRLCESPLERLLLYELMLLTNAHPCDYERHHLLSRDYGEPFYLGFSLRIYPQYELALPCPDSTREKSYRTDFLLLLTPPKQPQDVDYLSYLTDFLKFATAKVVVEVDGHD